MLSLILIPRGAGCVEESRRPPSFPKNRTTDHATDIKGEMTNMKISCLKEDLAHGLSVVNHAIPNRTPMAITQNVLLSAKDSKLKLSATNLEIFITTSAGAVIQEEGEITVPARLLTDLVNSLPNERIDLELPEGSGLLHLACAQATGPHQQHRRQGVPADPRNRRGHDRHGGPPGAPHRHLPDRLRRRCRGFPPGVDRR